MFENLSIGHILLILVVVLLLFGAKRLPEIGKSMGKGIREFKNSVSEMGSAVRGPTSEERLESRDYGASQTPAVREEEREPKRLL
jgi:sec-independent protein translocase protein TatA